MSATRASKRRKVDNEDEIPHHESSPALSTRTPAVYGKQAYSSPAVTANGEKSLSSKEIWQTAKMKSKTDRIKKSSEKPMDVYDDIEGANAGQYPYGRLDKNATPQKRKMLDPLVNQKGAESVTPKKDAKSTVGFFKQFAKKKTEESVANGNSRAASGRRASAAHTEESGGEDDNAQKSNGIGTGKMRGWAYGKPKKTFEDEIRELEEQARQGAAEKESEDELAPSSETPRPSARKPSSRIASVRPQVEKKDEPSARKAKTLPLDRRKTRTPSKAVVEDVRHEGPADEMDIDEPEDEPVKPTRKPAPDDVADVPKHSTPKKTVAQIPKRNTAKGGMSFDPDHLQIVQKVVLQKATGKRAIPLTNLADEYAKVHSVINQTITAGESNSMLLIGARGSGKSALVNQILQEQTLQHPHDFHAIRLNGFIHTDDKIALREIWRQLGREMELEEDEATSKNYADTMSKLFALLSHPTEMGMDQQKDQITKSVIFILDEFELFAGHPRQTLLYNLFDIAQSRKAPIAVLGLTTRIDVAESLEKRVKSRFSHRYVHLSLSKSYQAFEQVCRRALELTTKEMTEDELQSLEKTMKMQEESGGPKVDVPLGLIQWNTVVDQVLASDAFTTFLRRLYYTTKSVPEFLSSATLALATMPISSETTNNSLADHLISTHTSSALQPPDSKLTLLATLSTLQLALLICAARLTNIYNTEIISFALVYEEYKVLASKAKLQASASGQVGGGMRVWGKDVARGAWEELVESGLILADGRMGGTGRVDVGLEEIGGSGVELGSWGRWCREI